MRLSALHRRDRRLRGLAILAATALLIAGYVLLARGTDRNALWRIVGSECVPDQTQHGNPSPCAAVDLTHGWALLKDIRGKTQFLLIPTARVAGIEDPILQTAEAPDYFGAAWQGRRLVEQRLGRPLPRADVGLAVNSPAGRSQDQLHIHIDCLRPAVRDALRQHMAEIGESWSLLAVPLEGHKYHVRRIDQPELAGVFPFRLQPATPARGLQTLVAAGVDLPDGRPGFVLLDDAEDLHTHDRASGAELLDHSCAGVGG